MKNRAGIYLALFLIALLCCSTLTYSQVPVPPKTFSGDTSSKKTNNSKWKDYNANIYYKKLNSDIIYNPAMDINTFHRRPFSQPWYRDLGNLGSPVQNLLFTPEDRLGPTLGYHVYDVYKFHVDSLNYYNTTRAYSAFSFRLGSKLEQMVSFFHTQNIKPNWNFSVEYRKINSPGYYKIQRTNHDFANLTTNYQSKNKHYNLNGAIVYNHIQQDENGGIIFQRELDSLDFTNRKTLDVAFQNDNYSTLRSTVSNLQRDFTLLFQQDYSWGHVDTSYNADSTQYFTTLVPRFRITHKMELSTELYQYKDVLPDSFRYTGFFEHSFTGGFHIDSVFTQQKWFWVNNRVLLNGFLGQKGRQVQFSAGAGDRVDEFRTNYVYGFNSTKIVSNYLIGQLKKEALQQGQWFYQADAQFFATGSETGDLSLGAFAGRELKNNWGNFLAGFKQQVNNAPYSYTIYENQFDTITHSYNKESVSQVYATLQSPRLQLSGGIREYLVGNYIYVNDSHGFDQYSKTFSTTQLWLRKAFIIGSFVLDNELVYQQIDAGAPINIPALLGRHQLAYERDLFNKALRIATGIEVRYHTSYYCAGYDPFFNRFYYQNTYYLSNAPELSVFFNFRIKRFRAYIMGNQLQEIFATNTITAPGYPAPDAMLRFGFTWVMIN